MASQTVPISAFLTAITLLGVIGLGIMLGGALVLRREAGLSQELIGVFMLFTFLIVGITEIHAGQKSFEAVGFNGTEELFTLCATHAHTICDSAPGNTAWRAGFERH